MGILPRGVREFFGGHGDNSGPEAVPPAEYGPQNVRENGVLMARAEEIAGVVLDREAQLRAAVSRPEFKGASQAPLVAMRESILSGSELVAGDSPEARVARFLLSKESGRQALYSVVVELVEEKRARLKETVDPEETIRAVTENLALRLRQKSSAELPEALAEVVISLQEEKQDWKNLPVHLPGVQAMTPDMFDKVIVNLKREFSQV